MMTIRDGWSRWTMVAGIVACLSACGGGNGNEPTATATSLDGSSKAVKVPVNAATGRAPAEVVGEAAPAIYAKAPAGASAPIYRFAKISSGAYFFTGDENEKNVIISTYPDFRYEGSTFGKSTGVGASPVYRFANLSGNGAYFYTTSVAEKDATIANYSAIYRYEGSSFSVEAGPNSGNQLTYRLSNLRNGAYLYTVDPAERTAATATGIWRDEGVAFSSLPTLWEECVRTSSATVQMYTQCKDQSLISRLVGKFSGVSLTGAACSGSLSTNGDVSLTVNGKTRTSRLDASTVADQIYFVAATAGDPEPYYGFIADDPLSHGAIGFQMISSPVAANQQTDAAYLSWFPDSSRAVDSQSAPEETCKISSLGTNWVVSGKVTDSASNGIDNANVSVTLTVPYKTTTFSNGTYALQVPKNYSYPSYFAGTVSKAGYVPQPLLLSYSGSTVTTLTPTIVTRPATVADVILTKGLQVTHLGDSNYSGTVNSQFQYAAASGTSWSDTFTISAAQRSQYTTLCIQFNAKGVQTAGTVSLWRGSATSSTAALVMDVSPTSGAYAAQSKCFSTSPFSAGDVIRVQITTGLSGGDYDDIEFVSVSGVFR